MTRRALLLTVAVGLTVGVALGLSSERLATLWPASGADVFAGEPTADDRWFDPSFAAGEILDTRLVGTPGDTQVFAVRSTRDLSTSRPLPEPAVCIVATDPALTFFPAGCVPEPMFREQGFRGVLTGYASGNGGFGTFGTTGRLLSVVWPPRGELEVTDLTDELVLSRDELYTDADRALGLDIPAVDFLRFGEVDPEVERFVTSAVSAPDLGPAATGSATDIGAGIEAEAYVSVHPGAEPGDPRSVCLSLRVNGELVAPTCQALTAFRNGGITIEEIPADGMPGISVRFTADGGPEFDFPRP